MANVNLENVTKVFGSTVAVDHVSLKVNEGEFLTLLGPSGCGKTTTLRLVAGFLLATEGRVYIGGENVTALPPRKRNIGMVFQDYSLFPHMTVAENIAFGPRQRKVPKTQIPGRVRELLALIRLPGIENRYPAELSGGQQQRVALARALAFSPRVLLMDEPLGALDLKLREAMQIELHRIQRELKITTIFVTHDQGEAMSLSDRIVVLSDGRVEQIGAPEELYNKPQTPFVADFIGKINFVAGDVVKCDNRRCRLRLQTGDTIEGFANEAYAEGQTVRLAVRPEKLRLGDASGDNPGNRIIGTVRRRRFLGNAVQYFVDTPLGLTLLTEEKGQFEEFDLGASVAVTWSPEDSLIFPAEFGAKPL